MIAADREMLRARDAETRVAACTHFDAPLLVEAGAGTGKTATLVGRIVAWAMGPGWERAASRLTSDDADRIAADALGRIAAITFTEAAAAEMAERVGLALTRVEAGGLPLGLPDAALPSDPETRRARARALIGGLDHLVVRTIHAWCRRLLARWPLEAGLHPGFEVDADESFRQTVVREIVESTLRREQDVEGAAARHELALLGQGPVRIEEALSILLAEGVTPEAFAADFAAPERMAELRSGLSEAVAALQEAVSVPLAGIRGATAAACDALDPTLALLQTGDFAAFADALRDLWDGAAGNKLVAWSRGTFTKGEGKALDEDACRRCTAAAAALRPWIETLRKFDAGALERAREALLPLLREATRELRRRGALGFSDLLRETRDLLRADEGVCIQVRRGLDLLLVDEFQDTDPVQCEIVRAIALEGPPGERPSLFVVGDPKQSIYGWRRADLRAYDDFVRGLRAAGGEVRALVVNHRSVPAVLDEVERLVEPIMQRREGLQPAFEPLLPSEDNRNAAGFAVGDAAPIEHWVAWGWDPDGAAPDPGLRAVAATRLEARALARDLAALHRDHAVPWSDIAVLFRTTGDLDRYLEALRREGVPYAVERDRSYYRRREIIEAAAAVRCVLDPNDHMAFLTFLRSAYVGVPDAALLPLWTGDLPSKASALLGPEGLEALAASVHDAVARLPDDVPGLDRVEGWQHALLAGLESLAVLRASFERDPADVFVEKLRGLLLVEATEASRFLGAFRAGNLERFFQELALELSEGGDPEVLLRRLRAGVLESRDTEDARPRDPAEDAVRVMTIHKSKGLDFPHVYVAQLHKSAGGPPGGPPPVEVDDAGGRIEFVLFGAPTPAFAARAGRRAQREEAERVRELYVAATRAKRRLVVSGKWETRRGTLARLLADERAALDDLGARMGAVAETGGGWLDADGARWRFPGLPVVQGAAGARVAAARLEIEAAGRADVEARRARLRSADERMGRPLSRAASSRGSEGDTAEPDADWSESRARVHEELGDDTAVVRPVARSTAQLAGTAVHRALECFDLAAADAAAELERQRARVRAFVSGEPGAAAAADRADEILASFGTGPLLGALSALRDRVVARELALLSPPGDGDGTEAPVGFESGVLDLVYRDTDGRLVVADYKTDRVDGPDGVAALAARYREQGRFYAAGLQAALGLDYVPRFELWLLRRGETLEVPL